MLHDREELTHARGNLLEGVGAAAEQREINPWKPVSPIVNEAYAPRLGDQRARFAERVRVEADEPNTLELMEDGME